jgi:hypothetical protein
MRGAAETADGPAPASHHGARGFPPDTVGPPGVEPGTNGL